MNHNLAPGFRFYPTEEELISFYLHNKLKGIGPQIDRVIPVVDIYDHNPWVLPEYAGVNCRSGSEEQWFYFIPMQEKAARGGRPNRLTKEGYWKATGSPGYVYSSDNHQVIGMKRTMVFYKGRAPTGTKTEWKINEYIAMEPHTTNHAAPPKLRPEMSLCRVYIKSKSVRSFDRRPSGGVSTITSEGANKIAANSVVQYDQNHNHQNIIQMEKSSSQDSSSSGDHNLHHAMDYNEPWWDWEQINFD